ncbi:MAG: DUF2807 domain-containing protein [Spirochaetaceae bacterium]|nr:DUF2807 domain-containing protein [Spirochaetaceae bacterium]
MEYFEKLPKFSRIEISGRMTVQIETFGDNIVTNTENTMKINVRSGSIRDLDYYMSGETLILRKKSGAFQTRSIIITLNISNTISQLDVSTGALVRTFRNIFDERAEIRAESGSYLDLVVDASSLFINSGRDSSVIIKGRVNQVETRAVNSALIDAELLAVSRAFVYAYTGSTIKINALEYLEATASMKSAVYYKQTSAVKHLSELAGGEYIEF